MTPLPELPPEIRAKLLPYQYDPARQLARALTHGLDEWGYNGGVDLSDVGTGKSYMDTAAALMTGLKPVVLCPSVGIEGWNGVMSHFGAEAAHIGTYEAIRGNWRPNVGMFEGRFFKWKRPRDIVLILDEAQMVKGDSSMTTAVIGGAIIQEIPMIAASATLATSPLEMRIAGRITGMHNGGADWKRWLRAQGCHFDELEQRWRWDTRNGYVLNNINALLIPERGCRVRKADLGERPSNEIHPLPLKIPEAEALDKQWRTLKEKLDSMEKQPDRFSREVILATRRKGRMQLWKACEFALVPYVVPRIKQCLDEGKNVVAFFNFNESRQLAGKMLNTKAGFYGGQNKEQRKRLQKDFQANRIHLLLCNIKAGGASVSLHDLTGERQREAFIFPCDKPVLMRQAPGRIDRCGQQTPTVQWIPHIAGGFMAEMIRSVVRRMAQMDVINDGTGQKEFNHPRR